jgi:hypothetical protein
VVSDPSQKWEMLFRHALELIEDARRQQIPVDRWTFGGGTVLMRRHHHRLSKDVDIFIDDPQFLGYLTPRLSPVAESLTTDYVEDANFVKLRFPEGEVDFVVAAPLTSTPTREEHILGVPFLVEHSGEIIAKKVWHRGPEFTARDIFDFAMVAEWEPEVLTELAPILRSRRDAILARTQRHQESLRVTFQELAVMEYRRTFDECLEILKNTLASASRDHQANQS